MIKSKAITRPKVSICIPVYNSADYLTDCIDSLVSQTLSNIELIFVNDGSTDNSLNILNTYAKKYKNIKVISQNNTGLGGARNAGLRLARGEYIGFVDSDDFVDKTMYEKLYNAAKKSFAEIAMCDLKIFPEETKKNKWFTPYNGVVDGNFLHRNTQPWNKIVSKELIDRTNFQFFRKNGDGMFVLLMVQAKDIVSIDDQLYFYRAGHASMSTVHKVENYKLSIMSAELQAKLLNEMKDVGRLREYFEFRMIYVLVQMLAVSAAAGDREAFYGAVERLRQMNFKRNSYIWLLLRKEMSFLKFYSTLYILPMNYGLSKLLTAFVLKAAK